MTSEESPNWGAALSVRGGKLDLELPSEVWKSGRMGSGSGLIEDVLGVAEAIADEVDIESLVAAGLDIEPNEYDFVYGYPSLAELKSILAPTKILQGDSDEEMAIYVHIPFCTYACSFCYFAKRVGIRDDVVASYVDLLEREIETVGELLNGRPVTSVYFGGGTPTYLSAGQLLALMNALRVHFKIVDDCEWTVEGSPETLDRTKARSLVLGGINRISVGIQSFNDVRLRTLGRMHTSAEARHAIDAIMASGAKRHNIDLIYAFPGQDTPEILDDLAQVWESGAESVTWYQLWQHVNTPLRERVKRVGGLTARQVLRLKSVILAGMALTGYERDKVDWFVRSQEVAQRQQEHKWGGGDFIGLGVSAYGFVGGSYYRNYTSMREYSESVRRMGLGVGQGLELSSDQMMRRRLILGIKRARGVSKAVVGTGSVPLQREIQKRLALLQAARLISSEGTRIGLTWRGQMYGDNVANALALSAEDRILRSRSRDYAVSG